ncbi:hypothetical protein DPEC_G00152610 [Dallia pectoralis]|uniref:Uncharacterized protein n=1 Tax=Dallia pectoralis TaxID=75939 RepID=A0ACC2GJQ3_DALPE|nr:hypothetical protein DPEC_G00152610 [Dallia pectoralis]
MSPLINTLILLSLGKAVFSENVDILGGNLELKPDCITTNPPSSILWRLEKNKVADFDVDFGTDITYYGDFNGRTTLNTTTGELRIVGLKKSDEGVYSVDLDSKPCEKTYSLSVIKSVPKPEISVSCVDDKTYCNLTCNGDTADAEPVKYWWKVGEGNWETDWEKILNVTRSDSKPTQNNTKYTCKMKNAVSEKESEAVGPLFKPESVPKPEISVSCVDDKTYCNLTCNGDTADAEPVKYWWKVGEGNWETDWEKILNVTRSDSKPTQNNTKYTCKMKNAVSEKESEAVGPLFKPDAVPKPEISVSCEDDQTCILTCNGDTADAEPVTYWWKEGDGNWEKVGKILTVTKSDNKSNQNNYKYTCKLKNAVSEEEGEAVGPLFKQDSPSSRWAISSIAIISIVIIVIVITSALIIGFLRRKKTTVASLGAEPETII